MAFDRYAYAYNNPLYYTDPSGHCAFGLDTAICVELIFKILSELLINDLKDGSFDTPHDVHTAVSKTMAVATNSPFAGYRDATLSNVLTTQVSSDSPDLTSWLVETMNKNAAGSIATTSRGTNSGGLDDKFAAYLGLTAMVKDSAPWDYKVDFNERDVRSIILGGQKFSSDVVANIHFGFVGVASGFSLEELLVSAGEAQVWDKTSSWSYWNSNFDEPKDQWGIWLGAMLYYKYGTQLTQEGFIEAIKQYGDYLKNPL